MKDMTHIERSALPWRQERATECGLDAALHPTWTRAEAQQKLKEMGRQRFSLFACMTCLGTMERHSTWDDDPASCIVRHATPMMRGYYQRAGNEEARRFADELRAVAALIANHRDEFDKLSEQYGDVVAINDLRRKRGGEK